VDLTKRSSENVDAHAASATTAALRELPIEVRLQRLEALVAASQSLNRATGLDDTLRTILDHIRHQLDCERATVFLHDLRTGKLHARQMIGSDHIEILLERGVGIAGYVAESGESALVNDVQNDPRFDRATDLRTGFTTRTMLCVPLRHPEGTTLGSLQAINARAAAFDAADLAYLESFATLAAVAVQRERLAQEAFRAKLISTELELARTIQQRLLPPSGSIDLPAPYCAWGLSQPCYDVGGDAYDAVPLANGDLAFWLADVSGKGIGAALLMTTLQTELRALVREQTDLSRLASELNTRVSAVAPLGTYATLFLGVVCARSHTLRYVNAGHPPPLWWLPRDNTSTAHAPITHAPICNERSSTDINDEPSSTDTNDTHAAPRPGSQADSRTPRDCDAGGTPVGLLPEATYEVGTTDFPTGARLALFSDGLTDAENTSGATYDTRGVSTALSHADAADPARIGTQLFSDLDRFRAGTPAPDDTTLLLVGIDDYSGLDSCT
jgi:sigma-B regulation protein RsbU (phosphoserine phosphatase)